MMKVHSESKIRLIKELRQNGYSINEIVMILGVPKTTVWHHIRNVEVLVPYKKILDSKRGGSAERSKQAWVQAENTAKTILNGPNAKLALSAAMLYWGEGGKKECEITNTDTKLIQLYLKFLYDVLNLDQSNIKFILRIFTGMDKDECLRFWSESLGVGMNKFVVRYNDGGSKGKAKYGMCRLILKKGGNTLKLMHCLIRLGFSELMGLQIPATQWIDYKRPQDIRRLKHLPIVQRIEQDTPNV